jgi:ElaB/YqjD/DUF883 family membrane-anchored ribosome-binding protein
MSKRAGDESAADQESKREHKSSGEIREQIGQTRERVASDVEALGNKLSPENLKAEAKRALSDGVEHGKEAVREKLQLGRERVQGVVEATGSGVLGFVRENPIPLSLIGAGIGLLIWNSRKPRREGHAPDPSVVGRSAVYEDLDFEEETRGLTNGARRLQDRVRRGVDDMKHAASETAERARHRLGDLEQRAGEEAGKVKALAERKLEEQPLILGALAASAGLAIGLGIPATESENQLVGEYRDRLFGAVKERAQELAEVAEPSPS